MALDAFWMTHLEEMESLRESVRLRAYGQHDPLAEYRRESYGLFRQLLADFDKWINENKQKLEELEIGNKELGIRNKGGENKSVILNSKFIIQGNLGRNDPCPCGIGKKYKKCHGK